MRCSFEGHYANMLCIFQNTRQCHGEKQLDELSLSLSSSFGQGSRGLFMVPVQSVQLFRCTGRQTPGICHSMCHAAKVTSVIVSVNVAPSFSR